jgi:peptidoglycan hydrolase-like protein with peptidoglycan-binding domain
MKARKFGVRMAVVGMLAAVATGVAGVAGAGVASACIAQPARSESFAASLPQVWPGQHGPTVVGLQLALRRLGYPLEGTGFYGVHTLVAVHDYQVKHGIKGSGIVGSRTWQALVGGRPAVQTRAGPLTNPGLQPGARDQQTMWLLANALERIHPYGDFVMHQPEVPETYGLQWQALVKDFQRRAGIKASGIVGPRTWQALYSVVSIGGGWGC